MRINAGEFLTKRAMLSPDNEALVCSGNSYTFSQLNERANRLAHAMENLGVKPGDRVAILALNGVEYFDLLFGLGKLGAVLAPVNYRLSAPEVGEVLKDSGARVLVHGLEFAELAQGAAGSAPPFQAVVAGAEYEAVLAKADPREPMSEAADDDELAILYSGWTGSGPLGVALSHENFFWAAATATGTLTKLGPRFLLALPLFHIGALGWLHYFMYRGLTCVLMPRFEPGPFLDLIESEKINAFGAVPTMLHFLKETPGFDKCDFSRVNNILAYGQAVPVELIREYGKREIRVRQLYGLTESAGPSLVIDGEHAIEKAGSCGLPFFHTRVEIRDERGMEAARGEVGEVVVQAGHVMKCYWGRPEMSADALRGGWLYTGDLGRRDEDGFFYIVDRKKEIIISGGENVSPVEVERVIFDHPGVADVAVIGVEDPIWGELPKAIVVREKSAPGLGESDIIEWCKDRIAGFKAPRKVEFADSLPRTMTGKMEKRKLR